MPGFMPACTGAAISTVLPPILSRRWHQLCSASHLSSTPSDTTGAKASGITWLSLTLQLARFAYEAIDVGVGAWLQGHPVPYLKCQ